MIGEPSFDRLNFGTLSASREAITPARISSFAQAENEKPEKRVNHLRKLYTVLLCSALCIVAGASTLVDYFAPREQIYQYIIGIFFIAAVGGVAGVNFVLLFTPWEAWQYTTLCWVLFAIQTAGATIIASYAVAQAGQQNYPLFAFCGVAVVAIALALLLSVLNVKRQVNTEATVFNTLVAFLVVLQGALIVTDVPLSQLAMASIPIVAAAQILIVVTQTEKIGNVRASAGQKIVLDAILAPTDVLRALIQTAKVFADLII